MKYPTSLAMLASAFVLAALSVTATAQYRYTYQSGLVTGPTVRTEGVILVDVDGDDDLDVVFCNGYVLSNSGNAIQPTLLINKIDQALGLVNETSTRLPALAIRGTLPIAFDIDGDGDKDLVFAVNGPSQPRIYTNDGTGHFTDETATRLPAMNLAAPGCAYGDVDGDGDLDLFFNDGYSNGQLKLFLNDGTGVFTNATATHMISAPKTNQQDIVVCDIDNDWDLDVINCGKSSGQQIFFNDGTGHFTTVTTALLPAGTGLTYEMEACDLDHDGDLDLTMLSYSGLSDTVLRNNLIPSNTLSFTNLPGSLTGGNGNDDNEWLFVDSNNDGFLDICNGSLQSNGEKLYINNGAFSFARATGTNGFSPLVDPTLDMAVGDLNNDGVFDIVTAQGEFGNFTNRIYYGTGPVDTQPPRFVRAETVSGTNNTVGPWVVRAVIQDSMVDDGETSVRSATMDWTITHRGGVATGSTELRFVGGLFYRAELTAPPGVIMNGADVSYTLTATDREGNATMTPISSFTVCGLESYGLGLGGNHTTLLQGSGTTGLGGSVTYAWSNAGPTAAGLIGFSLDRAAMVLPIGTALIDPALFIGSYLVLADPNGAGTFGISLPVSTGFVGVHITCQAMFDPPFSLSNGVELVICQ